MSGSLQGFLASIRGARAPDAPTIGTATATGATTATVSFTAPANNGGATITSYTAISSPGGITGTLNQSGSGTITVSGLTASTSYTFVVYATNSVGNSSNSSASNSITTNASAGQQAYTTPGTYSWVAPAGVTSVSVVCIGPGGYAAGGLGWKNNISVTPGNSYTVVVGAADVYTHSYFSSSSLVRGEAANSSGGGGYVGDGGGYGGSGGSESGGKGAGGYTGNGGNGVLYGNGLAGSGGGGGSGAYYRYASDWCGPYYENSEVASGGGGTGIFGQGANGTAGVNVSPYNSTGGGGGSGGESGGQSLNAYGTPDTTYPGAGGNYGGGGGARYYVYWDPWDCSIGDGTLQQYINYKASAAGGAVRIIWGTGRSFPSTNTGNV